MRGLRTKTKDFHLSTLACSHDVVSICETNLCPSIYDSELFDTNEFVVYRCDRSSLNSRNASWGGVLIAVRSHLSSERILVPGTDNVEAVFVKLNLADRNVYLACIYVPSNSNVETYQAYASALRKFLDFIRCGVNDSIFVMGDFNMTNVFWTPDLDRENTLLPGEIHSSGDSDLICSLLEADLSQVNFVKNKQGKFLDLIFSNDPDNVLLRKADVPMSRVDRNFHEPIEFSYDVSDFDAMLPAENMQFYDVRNSDFGGFSNFFADAQWDHIFSDCATVDEAVDLFYEKLSDGLERFVPVLTKKHTSHPPWYTRTVINLKNRKSRAHKKLSKPHLLSDRVAYYSLNKEFQRKQKLAYESYLLDLQNGLTDNPRNFWKYVGSKKKTKGYPASMYLKDEKAAEPEGICDLFSKFFQSVYVADVKPVSAFSVNKIADIRSYTLSESEVRKALLSLDVGKGNGPDNVSPLLIKNCAESLFVPLHRIYNLSLSSRIFPCRWKSSYLTPVHKSGSRSDVENYRGIAILPTLGKVFELLICTRLNVELRGKLSRKQHGFLKGRSTSTNLMEFVSYTLNVIESKSQVDAVYTDIRKAFDQVRHGCLLQKLSELGFHQCMLDWIESYLLNREQYVKVLDYRSESFKVTSGLPQGSHLGPLLFVLYFNDVALIMKKAKCSLFADDLKIFHVVRNIKDAIDLQCDVDAFSAWCTRNFMSINVSKCKAMSFYRIKTPTIFTYSIDGADLTRVTEISDLGVLMDPTLSFKAHVDKKVAKAYSMLGFLKRICADFRNLKCLTSIYNAHVRSHLEYASVVWSPSSVSLSDSIESIQKKFVLFALRRSFQRNADYELPPYDVRRKVLGLERLSDRRKIGRVFFMADVLYRMVDAPDLSSMFNSCRYIPVHSYDLRTVNVFRPPYHRTDYGFNEPVSAICREFESFSVIYENSLTRENFRFRAKTMVNAFR